MDPAKLATGIGRKAEAGPQQAARMNRDVVLIVGEVSSVALVDEVCMYLSKRDHGSFAMRSAGTAGM